MQIRYRRELPALMRYLGLPLIAIEAGVAEGNFSCDLIDAGIEKLYSIDAWRTLNQTGDGSHAQDWHDKNYRTASYRLAKYGDKSIIIRGITYESADQIPDNTLGLVYLDGDHRQPGFGKDISAFWSKLVVGGIIATHDYESVEYDTKKVFTEFASANGLEIFLLPEDKEEDAGAYMIKK